MSPMDYDSFMAQKTEQEMFDETYLEGEVPTPILPRKPKEAGSQTPMFIGLVIFLVVIGLLAVYGTYFAPKTDTGGKDMKVIDRGVKGGNIRVVFTDTSFSTYDATGDTWTEARGGVVPVGVSILTGPESKRNIFSLNSLHTFRCTQNTKFTVDSSAPTTGFKQKVTITMQEGNMWVEGSGDIFEIGTSRGKVVSDGNDFQIEITEDGGINVYSWKGNISFFPTKNTQKISLLKANTMLSVESSGKETQKPINKITKTKWQEWNLQTKGEEAIAGVIKPIPEKVAAHPALASKATGKAKTEPTRAVKEVKEEKLTSDVEFPKERSATKQKQVATVKKVSTKKQTIKKGVLDNTALEEYYRIHGRPRSTGGTRTRTAKTGGKGKQTAIEFEKKEEAPVFGDKGVQPPPLDKKGESGEKMRSAYGDPGGGKDEKKEGGGGPQPPPIGAPAPPPGDGLPNPTPTPSGNPLNNPTGVPIPQANPRATILPTVDWNQRY